MFYLNKKAMLAASAAVFMPIAAAAVPISADQPYTFADVLPVGGTVVFDFEVTEALDIANFSINATDTNGGGDIANASFTYNVGAGVFDTIFSSSGVIGDMEATGTGFSFVPGWGGYEAGDIISFTFNDGIDDPISLGLSFQTTAAAVNPIPVPAAGLMLGSVVLAGGIFSRRRKTKA